MMPTLCTGCLIVVALFSFTDCDAAPKTEVPITHRLSTTTLTCKVDPTALLRPVPRGLFGTNLEWFNYANSISDADGRVDPAWATLLREQGVDNIRFPGGTLSDFYFWRDGIGPVKKRPERDHPTDEGHSPNVMGTPEFLRFVAAAGARPLITVNAGTSTPEDAAAWVAYANQPDHPERRADGVPAGLRVDLWEVGNELYLPGNPTDKKKITVTPAVYADRFLAFAAAMRKVDPTIKLMGIGTANAYTVALPYPDWSEIVLARAASEMDFFAVHNAYFPMVLGLSGLSTKSVYQSLWASPEAVARSLTALDRQLTRLEKGRRVEVAITEWGALFSFEKNWIDHVKTQGSAVYLARLMQVYLEQPRVTVANYFKFTDQTFMGWVGYDKKPKIPYYVVQLFARHFGTRLVTSSVPASPTFKTAALGPMAAENAVPELTSAAALDATGSKLFINIVNRSWDTIHQIKFDTGTFNAAKQGRTWSISSPGPTDHNGRDLPPHIPTSMYVEPPLHRDTKGPVGIKEKTFDLTQPLLIPPYSIVTVELDLRS